MVEKRQWWEVNIDIMNMILFLTKRNAAGQCGTNLESQPLLRFRQKDHKFKGLAGQFHV